MNINSKLISEVDSGLCWKIFQGLMLGFFGAEPGGLELMIRK